MSINASIHRQNLGSLAYVWVGDTEHVTGSTSEAHALMNRRGNVEFVRRTWHGSTSVEEFIITPRHREDTA
jgi:hypothetical protein